VAIDERGGIARRELLAGAPALLAACAGGARVAAPAAPPDDLGTARAAARYLRANAVATEHGLTWRKSPDEPGVLDADPYHGSSGVALFLLELHRATGERAALDEAIAGLAHVVATWPAAPAPWQVGLYGGLAGHAIVLRELASDTGDARHRAWVDDAIARLERAATPAERGGVEYGGITDVLYGGAGVILALLALGDERSRALAGRIGEGLLGRAERTANGRRWWMVPGDTRELPNFSHGTAGVAFALARLYEATRQPRYLEAAIAGADHVLSLARTEGDVCLVPHALPDGVERYYLAYCHGPAGTARLFHQLHEVTRDRRWAEWFRRSVNGVLQSGLPEQRTPGFWDNVGQCCGTAAIAELALSLDRLSPGAGYAELARALAGDILRRATPAAGGGLEWIHAENRAEPYWKQSYTGYMQGAAGIGSLFIRLAGHAGRRRWKVRLPDNPLPVA
jgi:lantibiotic modifying enzyme